VRNRTVGANQRSKCRMSGFPACVAAMAVISFTITSGAAVATASPTETASRPSITTPRAPISATRPSLASLVVVAVTS
jgi:hypothetical protein